MPTVLIPKECAGGETRVAATPETAGKLVKDGLSVLVEAGAGSGASIPDSRYTDAGARLAPSDGSAWGEADLILKVRCPSADEIERPKTGAIVVAFFEPHRNGAIVSRLLERGLVGLAMELIPRITRAQAMDALSSQASLAGYKAVIVAAERLGKYFPLLMTAAGTVPPAKVLVLGAGVAGLQAIATAKRLGASVRASDIRAAVKEEVESLGAKFVAMPSAQSDAATGGYAQAVDEATLAQQREIFAGHVAESDVVITTAQVPGRAAPRLVTAAMVRAMKPGSVIVDLAAGSGGNCELTQPDAETLVDGVRIVGHTNLPATVACDASLFYARNVLALVKLFAKAGAIALDREDEIVRGCLLKVQPAVG